MNLDGHKPPLPSTDKRWRLVDAAMRRNGYRPQGLIETLHAVQEAFGYVDDAALRFVSDALRVPPSQVLGVTTFYHQFKMKPQGRHTCVICTGTACYIKGNDRALEHVQKTYDVAVGGTTADKNLSLVAARCVGACGLAPVVILDGVVVGKLADEAIQARIKEWLKT